MIFFSCLTSSLLYSVSDIPLVVHDDDELPVLSDLMPTADVPLLSSLLSTSGAQAAYSSPAQNEDDLTSSRTYRSEESYDTTGDISEQSSIMETDGRWDIFKNLHMIFNAIHNTNRITVKKYTHVYFLINSVLANGSYSTVNFKKCYIKKYPNATYYNFGL